MAQKRAKRESYNPLLKSFPDSEKINAVSEGAEVLYLRLIAASDDAGRYWAEPAMVLAKLFTHRAVNRVVTVKGVGNRLAELEQIGLIRFYHFGGKRYLQMVDVFKRLRSGLPPHLFCPEPDSADEADTNPAAEPVRKSTLRMLEAVVCSVGADRETTEKSGVGGGDSGDGVAATSAQRSDNVVTTLAQRCCTNPTQPNHTQPNPTASALAAGVAAAGGAAHPDDIAASQSSLGGDGFVVVSDTPAPSAGVEPTPNQPPPNGPTPNGAGRVAVATRPSAAPVDGPRSAERESSPEASAAVSNAAGPCASRSPAKASAAVSNVAAPPPTAPPIAEPPTFATFWAAFPPRNGRKAGYAVAKGFFEELEPSDRRLCIEAVRNYAHEVRAGMRIPKDGDGFLRADYWRAWIGPPAAEPSTKYVDPNSQEAQVWSAE